MVIIKKFLKLANPKRGYYSHEDQNAHGLRFQVFYSDNNVALFGVIGEEDEIRKYVSCFGDNIRELDDVEMAEEVNARIKPRTEICTECGGTGKIVISEFDTVKAKAELDEIYVPAK